MVPIEVNRFCELCMFNLKPYQLLQWSIDYTPEVVEEKWNKKRSND